MQVEYMADTLCLLRSDSWPLQRSSAKKQQTLPVPVLVLQLERRKRVSRCEAGKHTSLVLPKAIKAVRRGRQVGIFPE